MPSLGDFCNVAEMSLSGERFVSSGQFALDDRQRTDAHFAGAARVMDGVAVLPGIID